MKLFFALVIATMGSLQPAPGDVFEIDLWPGEGLPVFEAVATRIELRELPSASSRIVQTLVVRPGQRLVFDDTRYRTTKPGRFIALTPTRVTGRTLGDVSRLSRSDYYSGKFAPAGVDITAGDRIAYLQYRAEGTCFVRIANAVIDTKPCPTEMKREFTLEAEPITEWWIHIIVDGEAAGWLLVIDSTAKVVRRVG